LIASWSTLCLAKEATVLTGGWSVYPPFSYEERARGLQHWTGLDVELLGQIAHRAGYKIESTEVNWSEHVREIETGERDVAASATRTLEREQFAWFSVPYRSETIVLIVPTGKSATLPAATEAALIEQIKSTGFRLGVDEGAAYPNELMRAFLADPANSKQVVAMKQEKLLDELLAGNIDGYLSNRIVAATNIAEHHAEYQVEEYPIMVHGDVHIMFSKASVAPETVKQFDLAIEAVKLDGSYSKLNEKYSFPVLVDLTLKSEWFFIADMIGTIAFALSGVLLAFRYNYDIFGAFVLASLPAVGGGVIRDLITNRETLAIVSSPIYLVTVVVLVVAGFAVIRIGRAIRQSGLGAAAAGLLQRRREHVEYLIQVFDAIGLAAFTVTGVVVAVATQSRPLWLWGPILAALTAAGGGILRDVVRSEPEISVLKGELYPEIAVVWGTILSFYMLWQTRQLDADGIMLGVGVTFAGAFLTRIATIHYGIRSPRFAAPSR
jgi:polar amino acid transport system substrate-binding protein